MIEVNDALSIIFEGIADKTKRLEFGIVKPEGWERGQTPIFTRDKTSYLDYSGPKGSLRILYNDNKIRFLTAPKAVNGQDDSEFTLLSSYLLIPEEYNEKDVKSIAAEINEELDISFSPKAIAKRSANDVKAQATVTRSQAKSGALLYDPATLTIKLSAIYPEFKDAYKENVAKYGEFLCEEFYVNYGTAFILDTIKKNHPQRMKKLFSILNDMYEDGSNETQSLIAVTILGSIQNDSQLMQNIYDYMSDTMFDSVVKVNKRLQKSKSTRMRLENPPKYKPPKKKKKSGIMSSITGQQQPLG